MLSEVDALDIGANYYLNLVGFVVLFYDYALTFRMEISGYWSPLQHDLGTAIFLLNRYVSFFGNIPIIVDVFYRYPTEKICHTFLTYHACLMIVIQINMGVVMITRTYALWGCSRKILTFLGILSSVVVGSGVWNMFSGKPEPTYSSIYHDIRGCASGLTYNQGYHLGTTWAGIFLFDTIIFSLTVYKSLKLRRICRRSIADGLLQDGAMYYALIGTMTLCNVLALFFGRRFGRGILTAVTNSLSAVCASRLMLNIRQVKKVGLNGSQSTSTSFGNNIQFTSAVFEAEPTFQLEELVEGVSHGPGRNVAEQSLLEESARAGPSF